MKNINERIEKIIEHSKLSNSEFADTIEVPRSSISHIISGRNKPSLDFLIKIKNEFPTFNWDWMIYGEGEMEKSEQEVVDKNIVEKAKPKTATLPDLFSLIDDDNFGYTESEDKISNAKAPEFPNPRSQTNKMVVEDSQPLATQESENKSQVAENQKSKIKRIVFFYENGKFETFEP